MSDIYDDPDFRAYRKRVQEELVPKLEESAMTISILPEGETDVKFAIELGLSIMMNKPIIAVVRPGVPVPAKLAAVVDEWVQGGDLNDEAGMAALRDAITAAVARLGER